MKDKLHCNSSTIHGGQEPDKAYGAVMPPIYQTSTYAQSTPGGHKGFEYSRTHNPTRQALEKSLASIEQGTFGFAFGSGLAAMDAVFKLLKPGDEIISTLWPFEAGSQVTVSPTSTLATSWLYTILFPLASLFSISIETSAAKVGVDRKAAIMRAYNII